jgi:DNA-binding response OmpR family regulator
MDSVGMKMRLTVLALVMAVTPQMRAAIHRAFRADEFEIVWTATPAEAVQASTRQPPSLVLLDVDQPFRAGQAVLQNLRNLHPDAPVVVLTDRSSALEAATGDSRVMVLRKPCRAALLADAACALLKTPSNPSALTSEWASDIRGTATNSEQFRALLIERSERPFELEPSYRHWGINE